MAWGVLGSMGVIHSISDNIHQQERYEASQREAQEAQRREEEAAEAAAKQVGIRTLFRPFLAAFGVDRSS